MSNTIFCYHDDDVTEACDLMQSHQVSRMIARYSQEQIADVISLRDIAGHKESSETLAAIVQDWHLSSTLSIGEGFKSRATGR